MKRLAFALALLALLAANALALPAGAVAGPALTGLTATTTTVAGGKTVSATVRLSAGAPTGGLVVSLRSGNEALATVPSSVTVSAGRTAAAVSVKTLGVSSVQTVTVTASYGGVDKSLTLTLNPATLASISVPKTVVGATTATGTVSLLGLAPSGGVTVQLAASGGVATVPDSVIVAAGKSTAKFSITSTVVGEPASTVVTASLGSAVKSGSLSVVPPQVSTLAFSPRTIGEGTSALGTLKLTGPAPSGGALVTLAVDPGVPVTLPSSIRVSAGSASATFQVTGKAVTVSTVVTVRATYGVSKSATVVVNPPSLATITLGKTTVAANGTVNGLVTLTSPAPAGGATVALSANSPALNVPATVLIPAGSKAVGFSATGNSPAVQTSVKLTGSYGGAVKTVSITVGAVPISPVALQSVTVAPNPAGGRSPAGVVVTLTRPAETGGFAVTLTSSDPAVLPFAGSYTIAAGRNALTLSATTGAVSADTIVTVTATGGGKTVSTDVTVRPFVLDSVILPANATGGNIVTGQVFLTGPAPDGGVTVELASNDTSLATVPSTVTIPGGESNATFEVTTVSVGTLLPVTITASAGGMTASGVMLLQPVVLVSVQALGDGSGGVITLNGPAPASGATFTLTSSDPALVSVPATVTVPAGQTSVSFLATNLSAQAQTVTVSASGSAGSGNAAITVPAPVSVTAASVDEEPAPPVEPTATPAPDPAPADASPAAAEQPAA